MEAYLVSVMLESDIVMDKAQRRDSDRYNDADYLV